jgi:hypothetical protein
MPSALTVHAMTESLRRLPRLLPSLVAGLRRWLHYRPERSYMRRR